MNNNTHSNHENATPNENTQQLYDTFIQQKITDTIHAIELNSEHAQSKEEQELLDGLHNPESDLYKEAVNEIVKNTIKTYEQAQHLSQEETELLSVLKSTQPPNIQLQSSDIPQEVMLQTVEKIALGWTRIDVAKHLMRQEPTPKWLHPLVKMDTTDAVNLLSQRLRTADPKSDKFAHTKYQAHADAVTRNAQQALKERVYDLMDAKIRDFEQMDAELKQLITDVKKEIDKTEDTTQKRQNVKLWMSLNKQKDERTISLLTHFLQILEAKQKNNL